MRFDLHRHLEGSHSARALLRVARDHEIRDPLFFDAATHRWKQEAELALELVMPAPSDDGRVFYSRIQKARAAYVSPEAIGQLAELAFDEVCAETDRAELRVSLFSMTRALYEHDGRADWIRSVEPVAYADRAETVLRQVLVARDTVAARFGRLLPIRLGLSRTFESVAHYRALAHMLRAHTASLSGLDILGIVTAPDAEPLPEALVAIIDELRPDLSDLTIHAGEFMGPPSVERTLALSPRGIGHGVRSIESRSLLDRLATDGVTLEVCPSSNALLIPTELERLRTLGGAHPLVALQRASVHCVLGSDDPVIFGTSMPREHELARELGCDLARLEADARRRWAQITGEELG